MNDERPVTEMDKDRYDVLARNLAAAVEAHRLGISASAAFKRHIGAPISDSWYRLARDLDEALDVALADFYVPKNGRP